MFDFHATFKGEELADWTRMYSKGGSLLCAYSYVVDGKFYKTKPKGAKWSHKVTFIDTMNYARMPLKSIGKILGVEKMSWDFNHVKEPTNEDLIRFKEYNMKDAEIARRFMEFLAESFFNFGSNVKLTIASTAERIFRNVFLNQVFRQEPIEHMDFIFRGYYGGRVEVFRRGFRSQKSRLYDVNSMYPWAMSEFSFPDPNTSHFVKLGDMNKLMNYEGFAEVAVRVPKMYRCPLPYRDKHNKILFPYGALEGVWPIVELRNALKQGCSIIKFKSMLYYTKIVNPFKEFVKYFYSRRNEYKKIKSPMEFVCKIILNSLYGKFAQRYGKIDDFLHIKELTDGIDSLGTDFEEMKDGVTFRVSRQRHPARFCFPCWSAYITAYARLKILNIMDELDADFGDTDSAVTSKFVEESAGLGGLKLEYEFEDMIVVRPKMYGLNHKIKDKQEVKFKGYNRLSVFNEFHGMIKNSIDTVTCKCTKFIKFRESVRRGLEINSIVEFNKNFSLEDDKRVWKDTFKLNEWQDSEPHRIIEGMTEIDYKKMQSILSNAV
jgi:hypothetical protein